MHINGYRLKTELKNADSGFSKWGFALKDGKEYFIKELISPVYPENTEMMSEELLVRKRLQCGKFEAKQKMIFERINSASRGNLVRIEEFFRYCGRYYIVTEKVCGKNPSVEYIASMTDEKKSFLLETAAYCFRDLHSVGIVHFDVKPSNIMIKISKKSMPCARLIDFDSSFFTDDVFEEKELGGDLTYLAPETFLAMSGELIIPNEKADIFSLGLVFHEYWCGCLPYFDRNKYEYPFEALLNEAALEPYRDMMPERIADLIKSMLSVMPKLRPTAEDIISALNDLKNESEAEPSDWFIPAGDL